MAFSEVLLLAPIEGLGNEGDSVKVRAGFARNFLLPRKMAIPVNRSNQRQIEALKAARVQRESTELQKAKALLAQLEKVSIAIAVKTGDGGRMFGAVTAQDVLARLKEEQIDLDRRRLALHHPIKTLGKHTTKIKLHPQVTFDFQFEIVSENPI